MAESKRTFQSAKMDKDVDDRILPNGTYRDALNVSVEFSEDGNVGALENLKGNSAVVGSFPNYLNPATNTGVEIIGSITHPEENKIYYFFSGANTDGIMEFDTTNPNSHVLRPIILDSTRPSEEETIIENGVVFTFADAVASATVRDDGRVFVTAELGTITALTTDFAETVFSPTLRNISVTVRVPDNYINSGELLQGILTATQPAIGNANIFPGLVTNITDTSATLNAYWVSNPGLTAIGFKYIENTGGTATQTVYTNSFIASNRDIYGNAITLWEEFEGRIPFNNVVGSDISVIDSDNNLLSPTEFTVETFESGRPHNIRFSSLYDFAAHDYFTIVQTSSGNTINNAVSASHIQTSGTDTPIASITSEFSADITGLTADSNYAVVAYATNPQGTVYTQPFYFKTNVSSILLPNFFNAGATAGTSLVVFNGTPTDNGGDANTQLYVVSSEAIGPTIADFKTAAATLIGGGTASGYVLNTIGSFTINSPQSVSVPTTGGVTRQGLVFAKNSSSNTSGSDPAGYTFDAALVSAQANSPVVYGTSTFSGTQSGPTGTFSPGATLNWSISGTTTVNTLGNVGTTHLHADASGGPGGTWALPSPSNLGTVGATATWNAQSTTTAPSSPGTYFWNMIVFYQSIASTGGSVTGSYTVA